MKTLKVNTQQRAQAERAGSDTALALLRMIEGRATVSAMAVADTACTTGENRAIAEQTREECIAQTAALEAALVAYVAEGKDPLATLRGAAAAHPKADVEQLAADLEMAVVVKGAFR